MRRRLAGIFEDMALGNAHMEAVAGAKRVHRSGDRHAQRTGKQPDMLRHAGPRRLRRPPSVAGSWPRVLQSVTNRETGDSIGQV